MNGMYDTNYLQMQDHLSRIKMFKNSNCDLLINSARANNSRD